jgi:hypothetical protein
MLYANAECINKSDDADKQDNPRDANVWTVSLSVHEHLTDISDWIMSLKQAINHATLRSTALGETEVASLIPIKQKLFSTGQPCSISQDTGC